MREKNNLAIFDLDGTLFDTKNVNFQAYAKALENYGIKLDYDFFCQFCNGRKYSEFLPMILKSSAINKQEIICQIHKEKKQNYKLFLNKAKPNKHLLKLISLTKEEYYIALATTASRENCLEILNRFEVVSFFDLISCQEDVEKTKPSPEQFNIIMAHFKINTENTIIFEDSDVGLEAAARSGAKYVRIFGYN